MLFALRVQPVSFLILHDVSPEYDFALVLSEVLWALCMLQVAKVHQ